MRVILIIDRKEVVHVDTKDQTSVDSFLDKVFPYPRNPKSPTVEVVIDQTDNVGDILVTR